MNGSWKIFITILAQTVFTVNAQKIGLGACPNTQVLQHLDITRYLGKWYEIEKFPNAFQTGDCTEANYGPVDNFGQVEVINKEIQNGQVVAVRGYAAQPRTPHGDLQVTLRVPFVGEQKSGYDVLATDYDNFAVVHSCTSFLRGSLKIEFAWILSRNRFLSPNQMYEVNEIINRNGLDRNAFRSTRQESCQNIDDHPYRLIA